MRRLFASFFAASAFVIVACGSSDKDEAPAVEASLEQVCQDLVKAGCDGISGCCKNGAGFDAFECTRQSMGDCLGSFGSEAVHAGTVIYNAAAAKACPLYGATGCPDTATATPTSKLDEAGTIACNSIVTGFRPLGSECNSSTQCAAVGEGAHPTCFTPQGTGSSSGGVCARRVFGDACSFSADSLTYTSCRIGQTCVIETMKNPAAQGKQRFEFTGKCVSPLKEGELCGPSATPTGGTGTQIGCDATLGLACAPVSTGMGSPQYKCVKPHQNVGEDCKDTFLCAAPLKCSTTTFKCEATTGPSASDGAFCYQPLAGTGGAGGAGGSGTGGSAGSGASGGGTADCKGVFNNPPACGTCLEGACCGVVAACKQDAVCLGCASNPNGSGCASNANLSTLLSCAKATCASQCGLGGLTARAWACVPSVFRRARAQARARRTPGGTPGRRCAARASAPGAAAMRAACRASPPARSPSSRPAAKRARRAPRAACRRARGALRTAGW